MNRKSLKDTFNQSRFLLTHGGIPRWWAHLLENVILFDLRHGTDTAGWKNDKDYPKDLPNVQHIRRYRASLQSEFDISINATERFLRQKGFSLDQAGFVDAGCGKGKILILMALHRATKSLKGIDFSSELLDIGRDNINIVANHENTRLPWAQISKEQVKRLHSIQWACEDVAAFRDYDPDLAVVYIYYPFDAEITKTMKENLEKSCKRAVVIYNYPEHRNIFTDWQCVYNTDNKNPDRKTAIFAYGFDT